MNLETKTYLFQSFLVSLLFSSIIAFFGDIYLQLLLNAFYFAIIISILIINLRHIFKIYAYSLNSYNDEYLANLFLF